MRPLATLLALLVAAPVAAADEPPPWMPSATPPPVSRATRQHARALRREAGIFAGVGIGLFAAGVAVGVVALDVPQGDLATRRADGSVVTERVRSDANWFELAGGIALMATGFALVSLALFRVKQARRLEAE